MTIAEVAKLAGVSSAAISRYFNNGYLSEEKKEAIRKVVEETGYRPSLHAATLRTKKTKTIGIIVPRVDSHVTDAMIEGIVDMLEKEDYHVLLAHTKNSLEKETEYLELLDINNVDGIIFSASVFTNKHLKLLKEKKIPVVIMNQQLKGYNCVFHDDYQALYDMTNMVLKKGAKKLSYISALHEDIAVGAQRYKGFMDALRDHDMGDLKDRTVISKGFRIQDGYDAAKQLLREFPDTDAIVSATDEMAVGALQYCRERGIRVPEDMMLTGQGDAIITRVTTPSITTIRYSYKEAGEMSARLLLDMIHATEQKSVMQMKLGYEIIEQGSTIRR